MEATKNQPKEDIPSVIKWRPPPVGFLKVNTDASFNPNTQQGPTGIVVRDDHGQVVAARSTWYDAVPNVNHCRSLWLQGWSQPNL